mgnify:CR=1 FL=1
MLSSYKRKRSTMANSTKPTTIDAYIQAFPPEVQERLQLIRQTVRDLAPDATEGISYGIAAFRLDGTYLVYLAGWKDYVSMYPLPEGDAELDAQLAPYKAAKGTARFSHKQPLPIPVIERIVQHNIWANSARTRR